MYTYRQNSVVYTSILIFHLSQVLLFASIIENCWTTCYSTFAVILFMRLCTSTHILYVIIITILYAYDSVVTVVKSLCSYIYARFSAAMYLCVLLQFMCIYMEYIILLYTHMFRMSPSGDLSILSGRNT